MGYEDKWLPCADCHQDFRYTAYEQEIAARRGSGTPQRCLRCLILRQKEKATFTAKSRDAQNESIRLGGGVSDAETNRP